MLKTNIHVADFANSVDPDEVAHNEPPQLDLNCSPSSLEFERRNSLDHFSLFYLNFASVKIIICLFWCLKVETHLSVT